MNTAETKTQSRISKLGWGILTGISALLVLNGAALYFFIAEMQEERTTAIMLSGFGLLALAVALQGFRTGSRSAWNATWVLVTLLVVIGVHILLTGNMVVGPFYLSLAAITLLGQLLAGRNPIS
jgi:hypothetical protein